MKTTGVAELKAHLSRFLEQVKGGQEVIVTERGLPIAKLVPLDAGEQRASRRRRLARAGLLHLGTGRVRTALLRPPRGRRTGGGVLKALLTEREEGR